VTPWRKRLADYAQLLRQADQTYFEPNLFRLNAQNAIQTARTVTFLIQKNKSAIPNFDAWYQQNVVQVLATDPVMKWLKDSRNFIEKEGDLAMFSECVVELLFSYTERGPQLTLKKEELLPAGIKKLLRFAQKLFPPGVTKESALIIDRRWVANTLPDMEVTDALQHGYGVLKNIVEALDQHVGEPERPEGHLQRLPLGSLLRRAYVKTDTGETVSVSLEPQTIPTDHATIQHLKTRYGINVFETMFLRDQESFSDAFERIAAAARHMFDVDGEHITIGFLLDRHLQPIQVRQVFFADRVEKFIYWSQLAHWASLNRDVSAVIFVSEFWMRNLAGYPLRPISELAIVGEGLHIVGLHKDGTYLSTRDRVVEQDGKKRIGEELREPESCPNFLIPLARVWGIDRFVGPNQPPREVTRQADQSCP
jgi:hypothetical protein